MHWIAAPQNRSLHGFPRRDHRYLLRNRPRHGHLPRGSGLRSDRDDAQSRQTRCTRRFGSEQRRGRRDPTPRCGGQRLDRLVPGRDPSGIRPDRRPRQQRGLREVGERRTTRPESSRTRHGDELLWRVEHDARRPSRDARARFRTHRHRDQHRGPDRPTLQRRLLRRQIRRRGYDGITRTGRFRARPDLCRSSNRDP